MSSLRDDRTVQVRRMQPMPLSRGRMHDTVLSISPRLKSTYA